tara:strand:+ start:141 stop:839 length:699 start_codon:yes stop_codon:yes gene_type:complete
MASILKVDKIRGTGLDSDTITLDGSGNLTIPKNITFSGNSTFSGSVTGDNSGSVDILANNTTGGSAVSEIVFDLSMDTKYAHQRFIIEDMYSSSTNDIFMRARRASDNAYFTGANDYAFSYRYATAGGAGGSGNNDAANGRIVGNGAGNTAAEAGCWTIDVYNNTVSGTGRGAHFHWTRFGWDGIYRSCTEEGVTSLRPTSPVPINQFKIYSSAGGGTLTFTGYVHYGIRRT